jgi:hypothetical protein
MLLTTRKNTSRDRNQPSSIVKKKNPEYSTGNTFVNHKMNMSGVSKTWMVKQHGAFCDDGLRIEQGKTVLEAKNNESKTGSSPLNRASRINPDVA